MFGAYAPGESYFGQAPVGPAYTAPVAQVLHLIAAYLFTLRLMGADMGTHNLLASAPRFIDMASGAGISPGDDVPQPDDLTAPTGPTDVGLE